MRGKQIGDPIIHFHNFSLCKQAIYFQAKCRVTAVDRTNIISFQSCKYISCRRTQPHRGPWGRGPRSIASGWHTAAREKPCPRVEMSATRKANENNCCLKRMQRLHKRCSDKRVLRKVTNYLDQINTKASQSQPGHGTQGLLTRKAVLHPKRFSYEYTYPWHTQCLYSDIRLRLQVIKILPVTEIIHLYLWQLILLLELRSHHTLCGWQTDNDAQTLQSCLTGYCERKTEITDSLKCFETLGR